MVLWGRITMRPGEQKMFKLDLRKTLLLGASLLVGGVAAVAFTGGAAVGQSLPTSGPAANGEPEWFYVDQAPRGGGPAGAPGAAPGAPGAGPAGGRAAAGGRAGGGRGAPQPIQACVADAAKMGVDASDRNELMIRWKEVPPACEKALETPTIAETTVDRSGNPTCVRSVICMSSNGQGISWNTNPQGLHNGTNNVHRINWRSNPLNLGYKPTYPYTPLIQGAGGAVSVAVDSKDNVWVIQRAAVRTDAISKFDKDGKLLFRLGDSVIGHFQKAHGMKIG